MDPNYTSIPNFSEEYSNLPPPPPGSLPPPPPAAHSKGRGSAGPPLMQAPSVMPRVDSARSKLKQPPVQSQQGSSHTVTGTAPAPGTAQKARRVSRQIYIKLPPENKQSVDAERYALSQQPELIKANKENQKSQYDRFRPLIEKEKSEKLLYKRTENTLIRSTLKLSLMQTELELAKEKLGIADFKNEFKKKLAEFNKTAKKLEKQLITTLNDYEKHYKKTLKQCQNTIKQTMSGNFAIMSEEEITAQHPTLQNILDSLGELEKIINYNKDIEAYNFGRTSPAIDLTKIKKKQQSILEETKHLLKYVEDTVLISANLHSVSAKHALDNFNQKNQGLQLAQLEKAHAEANRSCALASSVISKLKYVNAYFQLAEAKSNTAHAEANYNKAVSENSDGSSDSRFKIYKALQAWNKAQIEEARIAKKMTP